jgi:UDP-2,4-diacetamido-2,4,6-trideoxy-beta-L-altropyranose hydrolase
VSTVIVHADAGLKEGWGHLRESFEIAKALRVRGVECLVVVPAEFPEAADEASKLGFAVAPLPASDWQAGGEPAQLLRLIGSSGARHLVCDLLKVEPAYAKGVGPAVEGWAVATELPEDEVGTLNFNNSLRPEHFPLGEGYRGAVARTVRGDVSQVLVCYGGADSQNVTGHTLELLRASVASENLRIVAVLGPLFGDEPAVRATVADYPVPVEVLGPLTPHELAQVAVESDIAITTSGGTMYEFCSLGLPCIVVPILAKHETNARVLEERGAVVRTSIHDKLTDAELTDAVRRLQPEAARQAIATAAQREIDGMGAVRIAERLCEEWGIG